MAKKLLFQLFFIFSITSQAQECDCKAELQFLVERYTKDYSGFEDFKKLNPDFEIKFKSIISESAFVRKVVQCHQLIEGLISYLDNGHVVFGVLEENPNFDELYKDNTRDYFPSLIFPNSKIALLTIKTGNLEYKPDLDHLLITHQSKLDSIEHLIIDLRGNSGGGDDTYNRIIPFIYTNPIVSFGTFLWTSKNNIDLFEKFIGNPNVPKETRQQIENLVKKGKGNPNSFILLGEKLTDTLKFEVVKKYPQKVSILVDSGCMSATEEFLLKAKQSTKTTIYGFESTGGALDYSNLNTIITPSGYWYATVPTTRSGRLPQNPVDPNGILPDVLVHSNVKNLVEYVIELNY